MAKSRFVVVLGIAAAILILILLPHSQTAQVVPPEKTKPLEARATLVELPAQEQRQVNLPIQEGTGEVRQETGSVTILFTRQSGAQPNGINALLWKEDGSEKFQGQSNSSGKLEWRDLTPCQYRWRLQEGWSALMDPPYEVAHTRFVGEAIVSDATPAPNNLSGVFELHANEMLSFRVELLAQSTLFGMTNPKVRINILHLTQIADSSGTKTARLYDEEAVVTSDNNGFFEVKNLKPGKKLVRAEWAELPQRFLFVTTAVQLNPGVDYDLGYLQPNNTAIKGRVVLETAQGERINPKDVFKEPAKAELIIRSKGDMPEEGKLLAVVDVVIGEEFTLEGLFGGGYVIHYHHADWGWPNSEQIKFEQDRPQQATLFVPFGGVKQAELVVRVERLN